MLGCCSALYVSVIIRQYPGYQVQANNKFWTLDTIYERVQVVLKCVLAIRTKRTKVTYKLLFVYIVLEGIFYDLIINDRQLSVLSTSLLLDWLSTYEMIEQGASDCLSILIDLINSKRKHKFKVMKIKTNTSGRNIWIIIL